MAQWVQRLPASLKSWIPSPALYQLGVVEHRMVVSSRSSLATKSVQKEEPDLQREGIGRGEENRKREDREDEQK